MALGGVAAGGITGGLLACLLVQDGADPVVIPVFFALGTYGGILVLVRGREAGQSIGCFAFD